MTLAEIFKEDFYETGAIVSGIFVSKQYGFQQGFNVFEEERPFNDIHISSRSITERASKFMEKNKERRFFLFLHYFDPHARYFLHKEYDYFSSYIGRLKGGGQDIANIRELLGTFSEEDMDYLKSLYDSEISLTDGYIGKLLGKIHDLGLWDNTIVILTSDHGEEFRERGWWGHGRTLYDEVIRVPLIIKIPGYQLKIRESSITAGTIDIMPTIVEACELGINGGLEVQGRNLLDLIQLNASKSERKIFSEISGVKYREDLVEKTMFKQSIIYKGWKLIRNIEENSFELYNLENDTFEKDNTIDEHPDISSELKGHLKRWEKDNDFLSERHNVNNDLTMRSSLEKRLKDLGYLN
jgi:arylsulfatase A-like enzyme